MTDRAELYDRMVEVARANGFDGISDAIAKAKRAHAALRLAREA